jgi:hypothetical protein
MQEAGSNGKLKWKVIKEGLLLEQSSTKIEEISLNGFIYKDDQDIANTFKNYFKTCATNSSQNLPQGLYTSEVLPIGDTWSFKQTSEIELLKIIKSLQTKNSSGHDGLSNHMIKREPHLFSRLLLPLINESLDKVEFPSTLKTATVIPIFKKGD